MADGETPRPVMLSEQREVIGEHYRLAEQLYGAERCGPLMRKFGIKYAALHPRNDEVLRGVCASSLAAEWEQVLSQHYPS